MTSSSSSSSPDSNPASSEATPLDPLLLPLLLLPALFDGHSGNADELFLRSARTLVRVSTEAACSFARRCKPVKDFLSAEKEEAVLVDVGGFVVDDDDDDADADGDNAGAGDKEGGADVFL
mmetsp:Transcript_15144/g.31139  ORF Transcript_15144/g.31139 Transcript_15144/m.31139 type:complete len:121 (-) Transcript_15144:459-821(-)